MFFNSSKNFGEIVSLSHPESSNISSAFLKLAPFYLKKVKLIIIINN